MVKSLGRLAVAGAAVPIAYGVLAWIVRYPAITSRPYEAVWLLADLGMIVTIAVWLAGRVTTPRLGLIGGGIAVAGHLLRAGVSVVLEVRPGAAVDLPIVVSVALMFTGMALLGVATLRARRLTGPAAWAPMIVLGAGLVAAPFYSLQKDTHFVLLGLLWGGAWMYLALAGHRNLTGAAPARPAPVPAGVA